MTPKQIIRQLCKDYETTQTEIAEALGMNKSKFSRTIGGDMKLSTFLKIVEEIGARVIVQTDEDNYTINTKGELENG